MSQQSAQRSSVVAGCLMTQFVVIGTMFAYGVFFTQLEAEFGWSRTLLSAASALGMLVMGIVAFPAGRLSERVGPRIVLSVTGLAFGLGYAAMATMQTPWHLMLLYGLFVGIGLATHDVITLSTIARWFPHKRGTMTGIVKTGTAIGQILIPPAAAVLIGMFGWRTACLILGVTAGAILIVAAQWIKNPPGENAPQANTADKARATVPPPANNAVSQPSPLRAIARTRQFWTLCAMQAAFFPVLTTIPLHIVAHATDLGMGATQAATVLSVIGGASIAGRLLIGPTADRIGGRNAYLLCFSILLVSLLVIRQSESHQWLYLFALVYGFAHGGFFTVVSPTIAEYFDMKVHSSVFGAIVFFGTIGGAIGPLLAGYSFDGSGSYNTAFTSLIVLAVIGIALSASLNRPAHRVTRPKPATN